jgi:hypothetical protein
VLALTVLLTLGMKELRIEVETLMVEDVAHTLGLGAQVCLVVLVGGMLDRDLRAD